jgi:hypothetical protein
MKKSKFTEAQILFALKQADAGQQVADVLPADRDQRGDVLRLEKALREPGAPGGSGAAAAEGRERPAEEARGRSDARSARAAGSD